MAHSMRALLAMVDVFTYHHGREPHAFATIAFTTSHVEMR